MKIKKNNQKFTRRQLIGPAFIIIILLIAGLLIYRSQTNPAYEVNPATNEPGTEKLNLDPPTEEDKQRVETHKQELVRQQEEQGQSSPSGRTVTPIITDAGHYDQSIEVRAFVPGIYEAGGTCQIDFAKDNQKVSKQVAAVQDATTTRCTNLAVPRSEFPSAGSWSVTVKYLSQSSNGSSETKTLEVK